MALIGYAGLTKGLKVNGETRTFKFNGQDVEALKYLPIEDVESLINITLQESLEDDGLYNPITLEWRFHLNLVYAYCQIRFTDKQREDEAKIYDTLESNGFIQAFLNDFDEEVYNRYLDTLDDIITKKEANRQSLGYAFKQMTTDLPESTENAAQALKEFDEDEMSEIIGLAQRLGMNNSK